MRIHIKRIYEKSATSDGTRILVDRLWPRGVTKSEAHISEWLKDAAPSNELRKWFHADPEKHWKEFQKKYASELKEHKVPIKKSLGAVSGKVTFVTAVKDIDHSHIPVLLKFVSKLV